MYHARNRTQDALVKNHSIIFATSEFPSKWAILTPFHLPTMGTHFYPTSPLVSHPTSPFTLPLDNKARLSYLGVWDMSKLYTDAKYARIGLIPVQYQWFNIYCYTQLVNISSNRGAVTVLIKNVFVPFQLLCKNYKEVVCDVYFFQVWMSKKKRVFIANLKKFLLLLVVGIGLVSNVADCRSARFLSTSEHLNSPT